MINILGELGPCSPGRPQVFGVGIIYLIEAQDMVDVPSLATIFAGQFMDALLSIR
jgi:hypothetical protein